MIIVTIVNYGKGQSVDRQFSDGCHMPPGLTLTTEGSNGWPLNGEPSASHACRRMSWTFYTTYVTRNTFIDHLHRHRHQHNRINCYGAVQLKYAECAGKTRNPLQTCAIPERLRGEFTTRRYTNPRLPHLTLHTSTLQQQLYKQDCLLIESITTHEYVHLVTGRYFRSRTKDGGHAVRSAVDETPMLHAHFTALNYW